MAVLAAMPARDRRRSGAGRRSPPSPSPAEPRTASIPVIAKRVADIRGFAFKTLPDPVAVTPGAGAQGGARGPRPLLPGGAAARRRGDPQAAGADRAEREAARHLRLHVLPGRGRLLRPAHQAAADRQGRGHRHRGCSRRWCSPTSSRTRWRTSATASGSRSPPAATTRQLARLSLIEGSASWLMQRYVEDHFTAEEALGGSLAGAFADTGSLPAFLQTQLVFPYVGGLEFVKALRDRGRRALGPRGPRRALPPAHEHGAGHAPGASTCAPRSRGRVRAAACRCPGSRARPRRRVRRVADARAARRRGRRRVQRRRRGLGRRPLRALAAADGLGDCAVPCRGADVLVARWVWDTPRDEASSSASCASGSRTGSTTPPRCACSARGGAVTLVLAPGRKLASRRPSSPGPERPIRRTCASFSAASPAPAPTGSSYAVACADCGADMGPKPNRQGTLVWLLGGAVLGCVAMAVLSPSPLR